MSFEFIRDWSPEIDGPFPVKSRKYSGKREVLLAHRKGEYAGFATCEARIIGKESAGTLREIPAKYVGIALVNPSEAYIAEKAATKVEREAGREAGQIKKIQRKSDLAAIKAKREAGTALDASDINVLADALIALDSK